MLLIEDVLCKFQMSNLDAKHVELPSEQVAYLNWTAQSISDKFI